MINLPATKPVDPLDSLGFSSGGWFRWVARKPDTLTYTNCRVAQVGHNKLGRGLGGGCCCGDGSSQRTCRPKGAALGGGGETLCGSATTVQATPKQTGNGRPSYETDTQGNHGDYSGISSDNNGGLVHPVGGRRVHQAVLKGGGNGIFV